MRGGLYKAGQSSQHLPSIATRSSATFFHNDFLQEHHALAAVHACGQATGSTLYLRARLEYDVLLLPFPFIPFVAMTIVRCSSSAGHTAREDAKLKTSNILNDSRLLR